MSLHVTFTYSVNTGSTNLLAVITHVCNVLVGDLSNFVINNEWKVSDLVPVRTVKPYGNEFYTDVTYKLVMRRRQDFYVMTMLFPCMLVSIIAGIGE